MRQPATAPSNINKQVEVWEFPIPGGLVLAVPDFDGLFLLNPTAAFIWAQSRLGCAPKQIAACLSSAFDIPEGIALRDVSATLDYWADTLFVECPGCGASPKSPLQPTTSQAFDYRLHGKHFRIVLDSAELPAEILPRLTHLAPPPAPPDFTLRLFGRPRHSATGDRSPLPGRVRMAGTAPCGCLRDRFRLRRFSRRH
jgi:Coenzyme PQQ synthesis protein D (PqqD)